MFYTSELFYDAYSIEQGEEKTVTYRNGFTVYEEGLFNGIYSSLGWNGSGYVPQVISYPSVPRLNTNAFAESCAFNLVIDGQKLHSHWNWVSFEKELQEKGMLVTVKLQHKIRPVIVSIKTFLDGTSVITRWLEITNTGSYPAAVSEMSVMSGGLENTPRNKELLREGSVNYRVGYMDDPHWGYEGAFAWHNIDKDGHYFGGRHLRERYRHPMFILENNATGQCFIGQLAYSGGYRFDFDVNDNPWECWLAFKASIDQFAPIRVIDAGETIQTPAMHIGMMFGGLDVCVNEMNRHIRRSVIKYPVGNCKIAPQEGGIGPEMIMSQEAVIAQIDSAADRGSEIFFIDAAWYGPEGCEDKWLYLNGDWFPDVCRYQMGIDGIRGYCHKKGLKFGLWMEPERLGRDSKTFSEIGEKIGTRGYDEKLRGGINGGGCIVDVSKPEGAKWIEETLVKFIEFYKLDFFRLDFNVGNEATRSFNVNGDYLENADFRYYENWYAIFERLRERYPKIIFEGCASGGGRTDLGMVSRLSHTWVTDWQLAPRSFAIINGMSMCLPPEMIDRLIGGQSAHTFAEMDFQSRLLLFGRMTVGQMNTNAICKENPIHIERISRVIEIFNRIVRPMHECGSKIYHHTPDLGSLDPKGMIGVLELTSASGDTAILGAFQLCDPIVKEQKIKFKGIDISKNYKVTFDNSNRSTILSGYTLATEGVVINLPTALVSELIIADAVD